MPKLNEFYKFTQPIFSISLSHQLPLNIHLGMQVFGSGSDCRCYVLPVQERNIFRVVAVVTAGDF